MARGKIQIKRIENTTNRQVTYSKRRNGLIKKAQELTVLCEAEVCIIMISSSATKKIHEYTSPGITVKQAVDWYQKAKNIDVWSPQYEKMKETLRKLKEMNRRLQTEIRQRMGECLNDLSFEELRALEEDMEHASSIIRTRKYKQISSKTDITRKKLKNAEANHRRLCNDLAAREEDPNYGLVDKTGPYESVMTSLGPRVFALRLHPNHSVSMHSSAGSDLTYTLMSGN